MTFAEVLTAHNKYCNEAMSQVRDLLSQADVEEKKSRLQESERLATEAEKIIKSVEKTMRDFDSEHSGDVEALTRALGECPKRAHK